MRKSTLIFVAPLTLAAVAFATALHAADPSCATVYKAMDAGSRGKPYRMRSSNLDPDTGKVKSTTIAEAQPPGRMHTFNENGSETIAVRGQGTFNKAKGGSWEKAPFDLSDALLWAEDPKRADMTSHCKDRKSVV